MFIKPGCGWVFVICVLDFRLGWEGGLGKGVLGLFIKGVGVK